jgi:hypothetical protein
MRTAKTGSSEQLMWSLAGPNTELAAVLEELAAGRFVAASDYMRASWLPGEVASDARCYQMLLMAQVAMRSDGVSQHYPRRRGRRGWCRSGGEERGWP